MRIAGRSWPRIDARVFDEIAVLSAFPSGIWDPLSSARRDSLAGGWCVQKIDSGTPVFRVDGAQKIASDCHDRVLWSVVRNFSVGCCGVRARVVQCPSSSHGCPNAGGVVSQRSGTVAERLRSFAPLVESSTECRSFPPGDLTTNQLVVSAGHRFECDGISPPTDVWVMVTQYG